MEKKALSRIVRGHSDDIQSVDLVIPDSESKSYDLRSFKGAKIEGTYSQNELNEAMQTARLQGRIEGAKETEQKMMAPLRQALQNIENLLEDLSRFRRELFKEAELEVLEVIRILSKKIFSYELSLSQEKTLEFVKKALEVVEQEHRIIMLVNPNDLKTYAGAKADFIEKVQGIEKLEIGADGSQRPGTVKIRTKTEELDVNVESVVEHLMNQLEGESLESPSVNREEDTID